MRQRDRSLDFIKVIATILIVLHHYQQVMGVQFKNFNFFAGRFYFGNLVELFFIISGICAYRWIYSINDESSFIKFYLKRIRRLLPIMIISIIMDAVIWETFKNIYNVTVGMDKINLKNIVISCLGLQAGWGVENPMINNPMWYISVLLLCYIIFYIITKISKKIKISPFWLYGAMIAVGVSMITFHMQYPLLNDYSYRGYICFFVGIFMGSILKNKKDLISKLSLLAIVPLIIGFVAYLKNFYGYYMIAFIIWPSLIILLQSNIFNKITKQPLWSKAAKISYDVYVWHCPLLHLLLGIVMVNKINVYNTVPFMILTLVLAVIIGCISYWCLEKPIQNGIETLMLKKKSLKG